MTNSNTDLFDQKSVDERSGPPKNTNAQFNEFISLFKRFLPLSVTDFVMSFGDTLRTVALSYAFNTQISLAILGVVKSIAIFFESPIIMILHVSTKLSQNEKSRVELFKFTLFFALTITILFALCTLDPLFSYSMKNIYQIPSEWISTTRLAFWGMLFWPAIIAWRRFYHGGLIAIHREKYVAYGGILRLTTSALVLLIFVYVYPKGLVMAITSLMAALFIEALFTNLVFLKHKNELAPIQKAQAKRENLDPSAAFSYPQSIKGIGQYFFPLAQTMVYMWSLRAVLVILISRSENGTLMMAAWTAIWAIVLPLANAARMIQQVIISSDDIKMKKFISFAFCVGLLMSLPLFWGGYFSSGRSFLLFYLNHDLELVSEVRKILLFLFIFPFFVCWQNLLQGFLIKNMQNQIIKNATIINVVLTFLFTYMAINYFAWNGAQAASVGMFVGIIVENIVLYIFLKKV